MLISRLLLSGGYWKNGVACSVGRRITALETHSCYCSTDSKQPTTKITEMGVLRVFRDAKGNFELSPWGQTIDKENKGKLKRYLQRMTTNFKMGNAVVVSDVLCNKKPYDMVLSYCGPKDAKVNATEGIDEKKENVRCCIATGKKIVDLMAMGLTIFPESSETNHDDYYLPWLEGTYLGDWWPNKDFTPYTIEDPKRARINGQLWARYLSQMPPNKMRPDDVVKEATNQLCKIGVKVTAYKEIDRSMKAIIAVARGSKEGTILLECEFIGKKDAPLVLVVANGVTFDSGGLCLKKPENLLKHEGMTGAAAALGTIMGLAALKAPVNVKLVLPLCENMISGDCLMVGEVVTTKKGLNVKVEDTGLEGHLLLADALTYAQESKPKYVMSVAALTPDIATATGGVCYGCFTNKEDLWKVARDAGIETGDRPWRFPIWDSYAKLITGETAVYNLKNRGPGIASHCTGAAFLKKFVTCDNWLHYDITGVGKMTPETAPVYLDPNFMTGRPTRALIETIINLSKKKDNDDTCSLM